MLEQYNIYWSAEQCKALWREKTKENQEEYPQQTPFTQDAESYLLVSVEY